jgi:hypothetical protein
MNTSNKIRVKPAEGVNVKHPSHGRIINGEIDIESSKAVKRLIRFGDLIQVEVKKRKSNKENK